MTERTPIDWTNDATRATSELLLGDDERLGRVYGIIEERTAAGDVTTAGDLADELRELVRADLGQQLTGDTFTLELLDRALGLFLNEVRWLEVVEAFCATDPGFHFEPEPTADGPQPGTLWRFRVGLGDLVLYRVLSADAERVELDMLDRNTAESFGTEAIDRATFDRAYRRTTEPRAWRRIASR